MEYSLEISKYRPDVLPILSVISGAFSPFALNVGSKFRSYFPLLWVNFTPGEFYK